MARFEDAIKETLQWEGGYVNDPVDPGGETNMGVTKRDHPDLDILNLTVEQATEIYRQEYWNPLYDRIDSQAVGTKIFDMGVNMSPRRAVRKLQGVLFVIADGVFGPGTLAALNTAGEAVLPEYKARLESYYQDLVAVKPELGRFLKGWLRRVNS